MGILLDRIRPPLAGASRLRDQHSPATFLALAPGCLDAPCVVGLLASELAILKAAISPAAPVLRPKVTREASDLQPSEAQTG